MSIPRLPDAKDPADERRYEIDWSGVLPTGQTISAATVTRTGLDTPDAIPGGGAASGFATDAVWFWVAGGTAGTTATVTMTVTTSAGEIIERSIRIQIKER